MKVRHYSLNGEKPISRLKEFFRYKLPLVFYAPLSYILSLYNYVTHTKKDFKYKASLCLIFNNEAPYLKEWLDYHILIGIDHFYLYNNNSTDFFHLILQPYLEKGIVSLIDFPEQYAQVKAYRDCYDKTKNETEWLGYIDADEYINLISFDSIKDLLDSVKLYPSLYLNWRIFGTSGHLEENPGDLTIERFTQTWEHLSSTGKGFINNNYPDHSVSIHFHSTKILGLPVLGVMVNKSFMRTTHGICTKGIIGKAYINHYWSRSLAFYRYKDFVRGSAASKKHSNIRKNEGRFISYELRNITKDYSIQRWLIFLKADEIVEKSNLIFPQ